MERRPAIAVAAPNVLMGVGMKSILEKIIPAADVELFGDFESFTEANPERCVPKPRPFRDAKPRCWR